MNIDAKRVFFEAIKGGKGVDECLPLLGNILPKTLFKYYRSDNNAISSLREGYLWHSKPNQFNDPYDSQISWLGEMNLGDDTFFDAVRKNLNTNLKICSFSERNDSLLMWSHYAANHTGFCLEYKFSDLTQHLFPMQLYPIHYTDEVFDMNVSTKSRLNIYSMAILASISKHTDWKYEHEWRSFLWDNAIITQKIPAPIPIGIYFGAKSDMSNSNIKHAMEICLANRIFTHRMELSTEKFELNSQVLLCP